jgi:hypothetical protein
MHAGTPPQHFHILPSLDGRTLYLPVDIDCSSGRFNVTDCGASRGVQVFNSRPGVGFQRNASSSWNEIGTYRLSLGNEHGLIGNIIYGYDVIGASTSGTINTPTLKQQAIAPFASADFWLGRLGLSMFQLNISANDQPHSFLSRLKEEGHIPSLSFGYQVGASYRFTKVPGSLILGGYDRTRSSNDTLLLTSSEGHIVGLQSITATLANGTVTTLLKSGTLAFIDADVPELWLPPSLCDAFASAFGLTYNQESDRYYLTDTAHASLLDAAPAFNFTIGTSKSGGKSIIIEIPYAAFDLQASYPIFATPTNYFPLRKAANASQITLGRAFLQEVYLSVDWERDVFNISQAVFSASMPEPDIIAIDPKNKNESLIPLAGAVSGNSTKLSAGVIGGIVAGCLILLGLLGCCGLWFYKKKKKAQRHLTETGVHIVDEKTGASEFTTEIPEKMSVNRRTDLELEGTVVGGEPGTNSELQELGSKELYRREAVELGCVEPIYELPSQAVDK